MKETTYKCDLCMDICKEEILKGFNVGINGINMLNNVKDASHHICYRCIDYISMNGEWRNK